MLVSKQKPRRPREPKSERFVDIARELGCADDEAAFDEHLRAIATSESERNHAKVACDKDEGGDPKATAPARKGE